MKNKIIIGLFACVCVFQLAVPLSMITQRESVLKHGREIKFKTAPVDPFDAFRGRYVALGIEGSSVALPKGMVLRNGQTVFAHFVFDENGFAKFSTITACRPEGNSYIKAKSRYQSNNMVFLELPFERYYMEESSAPHAEELYRKHNQRAKQDAYITVKVKDGIAVISGLYVGGKKIEEAIKKK